MGSALVDRSEYSTLSDLRYLNQASLGLVGDRAVAAMHHFLDDVARHGNVHMSDDDEAGFLEALRDEASSLFAVDSGRIAVVAGASELLGQAPFLFAPRVGSEVLLVGTDFPAITRPWLRLAAEGVVSVRFVPDDRRSDLTTDLIEAIGPATSVVAVASTQYATGTTIDVPRLRAATSSVGARLVIDVTQTAGAVRTDPATCDADLVVCSGYKWLGGHGGVALGVVGSASLALVPPLPGWIGAADPFHFDATQVSFASDARRFTQSTMSYVSIVGLTESIAALCELDPGRIEDHAGVLAELLIDEAGRLGWEPFRDHGDTAASSHIVSLGHADRDAAAVVARLRAAQIVCGARLGRIRISLAPYNDASDVEALLRLLAE